MRRRKAVAPVARRVIKIGGLYRETVRAVTVTAEDHEIVGGHRTGRILVRAASGNDPFQRRWYCGDVALVEVQGDLAGIGDATAEVEP
jgi:hypothetical protein